MYVHYDEDCANDDTLSTTAQDWVRYDGERLVDNHVGEEESNK